LLLLFFFFFFFFGILLSIFMLATELYAPHHASQVVL
jgi:hypothetical protein